MRRYELQFWWTFKEVLDDMDSDDNQPWNLTKTFYQEFYTFFKNAPIWKDTTAAKTYIEELWQFIYARYYNEYILYTEHEDDELSPDQLTKFFTRLVNLLVLTYPKYSTLLAAYAQKENALLAQISSETTGVARFNDTPQNEEAGDEFAGDSHVTNLTQTRGTNLTDGMTPIQRLKEIQDSYKSVMRDWCNEFAILFIEEDNLSL